MSLHSIPVNQLSIGWPVFRLAVKCLTQSFRLKKNPALNDRFASDTLAPQAISQDQVLTCRRVAKDVILLLALIAVVVVVGVDCVSPDNSNYFIVTYIS